MAQWLRLCIPNAEELGSIPGQGTRSHMLELRTCVMQLKILHVTMKILCSVTKTQCSQIKKKKKNSMVLAQKQAHRSRKQKRESRGKTHIDMVNTSMTEEARIFNGEKIASSIKEIKEN